MFLGTDPTMADQACAGAARGATRVNRPVDIILTVDNSSSMDGEIRAIVERINVDFAQILDDSRVDYRIVLVSRHGPIGLDANDCDDHGICIEPPLAAGMCMPREAPMPTERFRHYSVCIDSTDSFEKLARTFDRDPPGWAGGFLRSAYFDAADDQVELDDAPNGWSEWLRPGATRVFLEITDDNSDVDHEDFVAWMYSKEARYFGTEESPNWVFHSILGIEENDPADAPYEPDDDIVDQQCDGGSGTGRDYQQLSIDSGGLRFPICNNDSFDAVFNAVAMNVIAGSMVPCRFAPSLVEGAPPPDFDRSLVYYDAGGDSAPRRLARTMNAGACAMGDYYVVDREIQLCPTACTEISGNPSAGLQVYVGCTVRCGDGMVEGAEECDDRNVVAGDGCSASCLLECGDGRVGPGEMCDDGDREGGDGCDGRCQREPF